NTPRMVPRSLRSALALASLAMLSPALAWAVPETASHAAEPPPPAPHIVPWHAIPLVVGLVLVAGLIGRFVPAHRRRLRGTVLLALTYLITMGTAYGFAYLHLGEAANTATWICELLELLVSINLVVIAFFELGFRMLRYEPATIVS